MHFVGAVPNRRVLDLGIGTGTYGWLLRQVLDVGEERWRRSDWQATIEGVEVFEPYRNPMWDYVYDRVHMGDIRQLLPTLGSFDVIVACDVLEHFPRDEARDLVRRLQERCGVLIATTPNREFPQEAWGGNEAERHHSTLDASDFANLVAVRVTGVTTCYVCTKDPALVKRLTTASALCPAVISPTPGILARLRFHIGGLLRKVNLRRDRVAPAE